MKECIAQTKKGKRNGRDKRERRFGRGYEEERAQSGVTTKACTGDQPYVNPEYTPKYTLIHTWVNGNGFYGLCFTLVPIWLPHWPVWMWTISLILWVGLGCWFGLTSMSSGGHGVSEKNPRASLPHLAHNDSQKPAKPQGKPARLLMSHGTIFCPRV